MIRLFVKRSEDYPWWYSLYIARDKEEPQGIIDGTLKKLAVAAEGIEEALGSLGYKFLAEQSGCNNFRFPWGLLACRIDKNYLSVWEEPFGK